MVIISNNIFDFKLFTKKNYIFRTLFGLTMGVSVTVTKNGQSVTNMPMAETIQDSITGNFAEIKMAWKVNGVDTPVDSVKNTFNIQTMNVNGNVWAFALQDDQPSIGGTVVLSSCAQGQTAPQITASFSCNTFINGVGNGNIPAVSALPTVVNNLASANKAGASNTATSPPVTNSPPAPVPATTAPGTTSPASSTGNSNGALSIAVSAPQFSPICSNNKW